MLQLNKFGPVAQQGLEHRAFNCQNFQKGAINWLDFFEYLKNKVSLRYAKDMYRYAQRYCNCLFEGDFSRLQPINPNKRNHILCALSNLSKYLGIYERFQRLVRAYGLKWKLNNADDLLLNRITKVQNEGEVLEWIKQVKEKVVGLDDFMDFCLISGLRVNEALASWNLIIELASQNRLGEYYNEGMETLEHFRFKQIFIRKTKKAFITFMPKAFLERIALNDKLTWPTIHNRLYKKKLPLRFGDIREYWATYMTKHLKESEIDFLQGRISSSIFMRNYFNPALISDLKHRVFRGVSELLRKTS